MFVKAFITNSIPFKNRFKILQFDRLHDLINDDDTVFKLYLKFLRINYQASSRKHFTGFAENA